MIVKLLLEYCNHHIIITYYYDTNNNAFSQIKWFPTRGGAQLIKNNHFQIQIWKKKSRIESAVYLNCVIYLFIHPSRYTEPASSSFGHHHWRFHTETFQAGCHWSSQGGNHCLHWVTLSACCSDLPPLWQCRSGRPYCLVSGVSYMQTTFIFWEMHMLNRSISKA